MGNWGTETLRISRCQNHMWAQFASLSHGTAKGPPAVWALGYSCTSIVSCWRSTGTILISWLCWVTHSVLHTFNNSCWLHPVMLSVHSRINFGPAEPSVILKSCVGLCLGCPGNLSSPKLSNCRKGCYLESHRCIVSHTKIGRWLYKSNKHYSSDSYK